MRKIAAFLLLIAIGCWPAPGLSLEKGAILYQTSQDDTMYGKTPSPADPDLDLPCVLTEIIIHREIGSGHVALYIGEEKIIHAVREGVVEEDSRNFLPESDLDKGYRYLGAKVPVDYDTWSDEEKDQLILKAKEQVGADYDPLLQHQKGPLDDGFSCVGLVEYVYEQVGYDITPSGFYPDADGLKDGRSNEVTYNCLETGFQDDTRTNTIAWEGEFSRFEHPLADTLNAGLRHDEDGQGDDERYIFFPYTQYRQGTTRTVSTDAPVSRESKTEAAVVWGCFIDSAARMWDFSGRAADEDSLQGSPGADERPGPDEPVHYLRRFFSLMIRRLPS